MRATLLFASSAVLLCLVASSAPLVVPRQAQALSAREEAQQAPDFDNAVAPLLARRCLDCHNSSARKGRLDLTTAKSARTGGKSGKVIVPGKPDESLLWQHVEKKRMPPKKPLPTVEKDLLKAWIAAGAKWGSDPIDPFRFTTEVRAGYDWWALQSVRTPKLPSVKDRKWVLNALDLFVLARLEAKGLQPSPAADRRTLIRRLSFDLLGLPPTPAEVEAFVNDPSPHAYEKLVDRLLASPHYGERWARHWLDVVRFGESHGFEHDELRPNAWPYRDWVVQAFNRDLPYDEFVRQQLAGDLLHPNDPAAIMATGFLVAGSYDSVGQTQQSAAMKAVVRQDELEDIAGSICQTFLGLTANCARCHDHKFDPVRQSEYYRLTAALAGVRHGQRDLTSSKTLAEQKRRAALAAKRLQDLARQIKVIDDPLRVQIRAERKKKGIAPPSAPRPLAAWDFQKELKDQVGALHATLRGNSKRDENGLKLDGKTGYADTVPLSRDLRAKTLAAWVTLADLKQRGGGVLSVQTFNGGTFDAIVFGEMEPGHWMAGSESFVRTLSLGGPPELEADRQPVHLALVYAGDGTITAYRNGKLYGKPYKKPGPVLFRAGKAQIVFGLRHSPVGGNRTLAGTLHSAQLFDRALKAEEVAILADGADYVSEEEVIARLQPEQKARRAQLQAEMQEEQAHLVPSKMLAYVVVPRPPEVAHVLLRGDPQKKGTIVTPGGVAALSGLRADFDLPANASDAKRRVKLAEWLTDPKNPLFPRVIMNRLWHYHFGVGLVDTPNDFGFNGGRPSHPELLDWLSAELIRKQWSLKKMHRLIVLSATYRQASRQNTAAAQVDAGNRLLWRKSPVRLEAEAVRDAMLSVAGELNAKMGGPGYRDFVHTIRGVTHYYEVIDQEGAEFQRRSLYRTWVRGGRNPFLDTLDCPDPSTTTPQRSVTTTPLQALSLLNNSFVLRMSERFAERVSREAGKDIDKQIRRAFELAYGRTPPADEIAQIRPVVEVHGLAVLCRALLNSNEFLYVD
jgi:hypothetical protein